MILMTGELNLLNVNTKTTLILNKTIANHEMHILFSVFFTL